MSESDKKEILETIVPKVDIYFFDKVLDFYSMELMTMDEFKKTKYYKDANYKFAYKYHNLSSNVKYVLVDEDNIIDRLDKKKRKIVYEQQMAMKRGLVVDGVVITNSLWKKLSLKEKEELFDKLVMKTEYF